MARSANPTTFSAYIKSKQDQREDKANAALVGMPVAQFKRTPQSKTIDRAIVALNRKQAGKRK